jgi:hypothetical protein
MKTTEEYLDDYLDKYNNLKKKNELWRLRVSPQKFLSEIDKIRTYGVDARERKYLNEYHIHKNEESMIEIMLMNAMTIEEIKDQSNKISSACEFQFAAETLEIQEKLKGFQSPLNFNKVKNIYTWLIRKQITIDMLSKDVFEDFSKTRHYIIFSKRKN